MEPTAVYDSYWRFAAERHAIYEKRLAGAHAPWTDDRVLRTYKFTNAFRAADRVSQYLIRNVQHREDRSQEPREVFYRTLLFKIFNLIETWELIENATGPIEWKRRNLADIGAALDKAVAVRHRIYSPAYIMPPPLLGHSRKHTNHLALLQRMMDDHLPNKVGSTGNLREVYELLLPYPGIGHFLAFQYAIDLNYSTLLEFDESQFVVPGPGALDGISKCFSDLGRSTPSDVIYTMCESQDAEFARRGLRFAGLFGRPLKPIDCQNLFCEIAKYSRVVHPGIRGFSGRTRIKQTFCPAGGRLQQPMFPPRWGLSVPIQPTGLTWGATEMQGDLFEGRH